VFFSYCPHVKGIDVSIYLNGWNKNSRYDENLMIYFDWEDEDVKDQIEKIEKRLNELSE
jgi:hypothetical protein